MLLLRWSSAEARRLYARMGERSQTTLLSASCEVSLDTVRSHTLLSRASSGASSAATTAAFTSMKTVEREAAEAVEEAQKLLERAMAYRGALPAAADLPCRIDDEEEHTRVQGSMDALRKVAARADEAMQLGDADVDSEEWE